MSKTDSKNTLNEPDLLYHYTTISGLIGIIKNKNIWATNINHLNDWKEFWEFVNPFLKRLQGTGIEKHVERIFDKHTRNIYVCSFSQKCDDLSQWRAYSQNSKGFSIGFNYSKLKNMLPSDELFVLRRCMYYNEEDIEIEISNVIDRNKKPDSFEIHDLTKIITELTTLAPCYKNATFKDEEEWRLVNFVKNEEIKFREGKTLIIPYIEIDLKDKKDGKLPIENICIGPTPYMAESKLSLDIFLKQNGLTKVGIIKSEVPYRTL